MPLLLPFATLGRHHVPRPAPRCLVLLHLARSYPPLTAATTATHGIHCANGLPHAPLPTPAQALPKAVALLGVGAGLSLMVLVALLTWFTVHGGREGA